MKAVRNILGTNACLTGSAIFFCRKKKRGSEKPALAILSAAALGGSVPDKAALGACS
jgi:hypothetical protein